MEFPSIQFVWNMWAANYSNKHNKATHRRAKRMHAVSFIWLVETQVIEMREMKIKNQKNNKYVGWLNAFLMDTCSFVWNSKLELRGRWWIVWIQNGRSANDVCYRMFAIRYEWLTQLGRSGKVDRRRFCWFFKFRILFRAILVYFKIYFCFPHSATWADFRAAARRANRNSTPFRCNKSYQGSPKFSGIAWKLA